MRRRRTPEIIAGRVSSGGMPVLGEDYIVEVVATGTYRVRFTDRNFRLIAVTVTSQNDGQFMQAAIDAGNMSFLCTNRISNTHAVTSAGFSFVAVGQS